MLVCSYKIKDQDFWIDIYHNRAECSDGEITKTYWLYEDIGDLLEQCGKLDQIDNLVLLPGA